MIYLLTILLVILILINPPIRKVIIKTNNQEIEKYKWIIKNPFSKHGTFHFRYSWILNEIDIRFYLSEEHREYITFDDLNKKEKVEIEIK